MQFSIVDLLPTLLDLATDGKPPALVDHCDGHSLCGWLRGNDASWKDQALVEFTKFLNDEGARWTKLVKDANIKPD